MKQQESSVVQDVAQAMRQLIQRMLYPTPVQQLEGERKRIAEMNDYALVWEWLISAMAWSATAFLFIMSWTFGLPVHLIAWAVRRHKLASLDKQIEPFHLSSLK